MVLGPGVAMDEHEVRLIERHRRWEREVPPLPPVEETRATVAERLAATCEAREAVFAEIERCRDDTIALLRTMVRIPSVNPSEGFEQEMAAFTARELRALGLATTEIETAPRRGNVLGRWWISEGPSLLFYAHLDTVPVGDLAEWSYPPFAATVADGRIWGRGAKDCKLGLAAAMMALRALRAARVPLRGEAQVVAVADEEMGGHLGIAQLVDRGLIRADYAIYGEGFPTRVTIGHKGWVNLRITTRGKTAHTGYKQAGDNAILKMCRLAPLIEMLDFPEFSPHPVVPGRPLASVNIIQGGFKTNVVPDRCSITVDLRYPPGLTLEAILARVQQVLAEARACDPALGEVDVELTNLARPSFMLPEEPLVEYMAAAVEAVTSRRPTAEGMQATSDSRWILLDAGVPIVNFSMGNDSGHRPNEWCGIDDLIATTKIYALMCLLLLC